MNARLQAAEDAVGRMADILTQLAASGNLPSAVADQLDSIQLKQNLTKAEPKVSIPIKNIHNFEYEVAFQLVGCC